MYANKERKGVGRRRDTTRLKNILLNDFHRKKKANGKSSMYDDIKILFQC